MPATPARLQTERLILRPWQAEDQTPFAALCADPAVMEHFVAPLTTAESAAMFERIREHFARRGFGPWAVELPGEAAFIGFVGLIEVPNAVHFAPAVEAAWRLARPFWGRGYATEAAAESLRFGFQDLGLDEIVAYTVPANHRSQRVMEKLGMARRPEDDFDHPRVPDGHRLRRHVLYRIHREQWLAKPPASGGQEE